MNREEELIELNRALQESNKKLKEELERKNTLINNLPCTVSWINSDLEYLAINDELENMFEINKGVFQRKKVGFLNSDNNPFLDFMSSFFQEGDSFRESEFSVNVNGEVKHQLVMAQKYKGGKEAVVIGFDTTEKVKLHEEITHGERLRTIGELSAGVVHEIKNPLTVIAGNADISLELLEDNELDQESLARLKLNIEKILKMNDRINTIINSLKNVARDSVHDEKEATPVTNILEETLAICKAKINKYGTIFEKEVSTDKNQTINCIEGQIIQVLVNLIGNATEVGMDKAEHWVNLIVSDEGDSIGFRVVDSGAGISEQVLDKMFDPFFTTKPKGVGTGMGLGICRKIALEHFGSLDYELFSGNTSFILKIPK